MGQSEPELRIRTLALVVLPLVASPLASKFRVPRSVQPPHGKLRPPLVPDAAPSVNRYRRSLSRGNNNSAVLDIVSCVRQVLQIRIPKVEYSNVEAVETVNRTFYPVQGAVGKLVVVFPQLRQFPQPVFN